MNEKNYVLLTNILLSHSVMDNFYNAYLQNANFKNWLLQIMPQIEDCRLQQQNTPWHKYNVLDHSLKSVEEINKLSRELPFYEKQMLAYIMFLHDIGKPYCRKDKTKNGMLLDSFPNHTKKSAEMSKSILSKLNFDEKQISIMAKLIEYHDIFKETMEQRQLTNNANSVISKEFILQLVREFNLIDNGINMTKKLLIIQKADTLAKNEKMVQEPLQIIQKLTKILDEIIKEQEKERIK